MRMVVFSKEVHMKRVGRRRKRSRNDNSSDSGDSLVITNSINGANSGGDDDNDPPPVARHLRISICEPLLTINDVIICIITQTNIRTSHHAMVLCHHADDSYKDYH